MVSVRGDLRVAFCFSFFHFFLVTALSFFLIVLFDCARFVLSVGYHVAVVEAWRVPIFFFCLVVSLVLLLRW
jgi:hypothetical protein